MINNDDNGVVLDSLSWSVRKKRREIGLECGKYFKCLSFGQLILEANDIITQLKSSETVDDDLIIKAEFLLDELNFRVSMGSSTEFNIM